MRSSIFGLALALVACGRTGTEPSAVLHAADGDSVAIQLGDTVRVQGLAVTFTDVLEDSRCPADVVCIWEGDARVALEVVDGVGREYAVNLSLHPPQREAVVLGRRIEFVNLSPYPDTRVRFPKSAYRVGLFIAQLPD